MKARATAFSSDSLKIVRYAENREIIPNTKICPKIRKSGIANILFRIMMTSQILSWISISVINDFCMESTEDFLVTFNCVMNLKVEILTRRIFRRMSRLTFSLFPAKTF